MTSTVFVDAAGGQVGGAARFRVELARYLERAARADIKVIGVGRRLDSAWLVRREIGRPVKGRLVALNNVSFVAPGGERWTRLGNPLDFLNDEEWANLHPSLRRSTQLRASVVHLSARRSHVIVTPSAAMAERVARVLPDLRSRIIPRLNPVSPEPVTRGGRLSSILCPVLFAPYKHMAERLTELLAALDEYGDPSVEVVITANNTEVPVQLANHPRVRLAGRLDHNALRPLWAKSRAIYFPSGIESFGYPLAEARVNGQAVIALDTTQNREIAGPALCGFALGDADSLGFAVERALTTEVAPDPSPFDPDAYFTWLFGAAR